MDGLCDVQGCQSLPLLGWRPLTERISRKICEQHWCRHKNKQDSFNLYEVFGFKRHEVIPRSTVKTQAQECDCGRELLPGHRLCTVCAKEHERQRKRQYYHNKKNHQVEPVEESTLQCRQCGGPRLPDHIYCSTCAKRRKTMTRRQAQSRYWKKQHICQV